MITHRSTTRLLAASGALVFTAVAVSAGVIDSGFTPTPKADRFQTVAEKLCADQSWPNISPGCVSWKSATVAQGRVRFITDARTDQNSATTTLIRVPVSR